MISCKVGCGDIRSLSVGIRRNVLLCPQLSRSTEPILSPENFRETQLSAEVEHQLLLAATGWIPGRFATRLDPGAGLVGAGRLPAPSGAPPPAAGQHQGQLAVPARQPHRFRSLPGKIELSPSCGRHPLEVRTTSTVVFALLTLLLLNKYPSLHFKATFYLWTVFRS